MIDDRYVAFLQHGQVVGNENLEPGFKTVSLNNRFMHVDYHGGGFDIDNARYLVRNESHLSGVYDTELDVDTGVNTEYRKNNGEFEKSIDAAVEIYQLKGYSRKKIRKMLAEHRHKKYHIDNNVIRLAGREYKKGLYGFDRILVVNESKNQKYDGDGSMVVINVYYDRKGVVYVTSENLTYKYIEPIIIIKSADYREVAKAVGKQIEKLCYSPSQYITKIHSKVTYFDIDGIIPEIWEGWIKNLNKHINETTILLSKIQQINSLEE